MNFLFRYVVPYLGFLGTAVGGIVAGQQVNASNLGVLIAFFIGLLTVGFWKFSPTPIRVGVWFVVATIPGTISYLLCAGLVSVPLKQYSGLLIFWMAVWVIFKYNQFSPEKLFSIYLQCAKLSAAIGIFQQLGYLVGIQYFYDYSWMLIGAAELDTSGSFARVYSLFTEPSYFAVFLMPAIYFSLLRLFGKSNVLTIFEGFLFLLALFCTFSTIGYMGFLLCVVFSVKKNFRNIFCGLLLFCAVAMMGYSNVSIKSRISAIPNALSMDVDGSENFSTLNNGVNLFIAKSMFADYPFIGVGVGSYREYSNYYIYDLLEGNPIFSGMLGDSLDGLTLADGGSMYLRLITELGAVGMLVLMSIFFCNRRSCISEHRKYIAIASIIFILIFSVRSGQLVRFDFMFFCALFSLIWFRGLIGVKNKASLLNKDHKDDREIFV